MRRWSQEFYEWRQERDFKEEASETRASMQLKGTDICIDIYCKCGARGHFDGYFLYHFECENCGQVYAVGSSVKMVPVDTKYKEDALAWCFQTLEWDLK